LLELTDLNAKDYTGLQCAASSVERNASRFGKSAHTGKKEAGAMRPGIVHNLLTPVSKKALLTWERLESGISSDLTSSEIRANPYDFVTTQPQLICEPE